MAMSKREKMLILTGALGDGHVQAANAVAEAAAIAAPEMEVKVVEFMEWIHPRTHAFERYCFLQWMKHFPATYGYLYQKTRTDNPLSGLIKRVRMSSLQRLLRLIQAEQPTVLVSTFPLASAAISLLKAKRMTSLPAVTIITDHSDHSFWIYPCTDLYLVGSPEVGAALYRKGVPLGKIAVTGIPVRPSFGRSGDKDLLRKKLGLSPSAFVVLVMGGGCGMIREAFVDQMRLKQLPDHMQMVLICGRNARLLQRMRQSFRGEDHVMVKGFVANVHEWMAAADVLVTKPGGLTTSEAVALRLPMILFEPKLGQERDNAEYLIRKGVAVLCRSGDPSFWLERMIRNPALLREMKAMAANCGQQNSALESVRHILGILHPAANPALRHHSQQRWGNLG